MHVLVLSLVYPPDGVSTAVIVGELSADLVRAGHDVTAVTTVPHYNRDAEAEARQPLTRLWGPLVSRSQFEGARVFHVAMPRKTGRVLMRLLAWMQFHVLSLFVALAHVRRVDVILAPSPPLTVGLVAWVLSWAYGAPFVYNAQELYPDIAITMGALKNRRTIAFLRAVERFVYARARVITVIAPRMRRRVIDKGVAAEKVQLVPNFVDVDGLSPSPRDNTFGRAHGLASSFVVTYAGNIGPTQGLDILLDAAALLKHRELSVTMVLVGEGSEHERLRTSARERGLANVLVLPHHPYAVVPQIYAASDLCVVPLAPNTGSEAVPSKVYRIMACARPVVACTDEDSDLAELVRRAQCGIVIAPGSADALAEAIVRAAQAPANCASMGDSGRRHVIAHYARSAISAQYETLLREACRAEPRLSHDA